MKKTLTVFGSAMFAMVSAHAQTALPEYQTQNAWFTDAQIQLERKLAIKNTFKAKNVILFVGDGMGISTLTSA
ncbi:hypothetical protein [Opacimonas viscosa]|uniref:hypothetical protein n=1 Tax=Opacimonas viscosa TaxID=2961944 RepID=UPI003D7A7FE1